MSISTDTHFFSVMTVLEHLKPNEQQTLNRYEQLFAFALYASKLQNLAEHYWSLKEMTH